MTRTNEISLLIGGQAGAGISAAGLLLGKTFLRGGLHVFGTIDYPSLIRGGHNFYLLRAATRPVFAQWDKIDLMIALDERTLERHREELVSDGGVIFDSDEISPDSPNLPPSGVQRYAVPLESIVKELNAPKVVQNTIALGAALGILGYGITQLEEILQETFKAKGDKIVSMNVDAARKGYNYAHEHFASEFCCQLKPRTGKHHQHMLLTGNEAVGLGAIAAGCKFIAAYPMTPASPLFHFLIAQAERFGIVTLQAESEIAAINMTIGAAYAGLRAMTSTSGGGFCLMTEGLSMAGMTETPVVIMLGQRTGPSTGLPTYTAQGDLHFALHAGHGEFPRVVIAPGDIRECFQLTIDAFNLAEEFQTPVILLTDKHLIESHITTQTFDTGLVSIDRGKLLPMERYTGPTPYLRFKLVDDGISPRLVPGTLGATVHADSAEHGEQGFVNDTADNTRQMADKRFRKRSEIQKALSRYDAVKTFGSKDADVTLVGWGSTKGVVLEAVEILQEEGRSLNFLQIIFMAPFPAQLVSKALKGKTTILVESNRTAQLGSLIREQTGHRVAHKILRYDGRPFNPLQLVARIKEVLK
ncbi:MAG: 2-oxoacid:acceptor oxidoreductase subunit alpha [Promethearchaeota archaeon]